MTCCERSPDLPHALVLRDSSATASSGNVVQLEVPANPLRPIIVSKPGTDRRGLAMPVNLDRLRR